MYASLFSRLCTNDAVPLSFEYMHSTSYHVIYEVCLPLEDNLQGPYLAGNFSLADVSALPFFERLVFSCRKFKNYEIPFHACN